MAEEIILEESGIRFTLSGIEDTNGKVMGNKAREGDGTSVTVFKNLISAM